MRNTRPPQHRGFTLVEMLVVIVIIGILAAILVPTVAMAIRRSKIGATGLEIDRLTQAVEAYRLDNNDYPPDFTNWDAVESHVRRAFPRNTENIKTWLGSTLPSGSRPATLDPAEALVVWLSQVRNNPRDPLGIGSSSGDAKEYFEFDQTRLVDLDSDGWNEYVPTHARNAPYVYFDGRIQTAATSLAANAPKVPTCAYAWAAYPMPILPASDPNYKPNDSRARDPSVLPAAGTTPVVGVVRPFRSSSVASDTTTWPAGGQWIAHKKFQIVCAGLDSNFGEDVGYKSFPDPDYPVADEDSDNMASFSEGRTIEDHIP